MGGAEKYFKKIMAENFSNIVKNIKQIQIQIQIQEAKWNLNRTNSKKSTLMFIIVKYLKLKTKKNILKSVSEKQHFTYRGNKSNDSGLLTRNNKDQKKSA